MKEFINSNWECRLTAPISLRERPPKYNLYWPWGLIFSHNSPWQRHDIPLVPPDGIVLDFEARHDEFTYVTDMSGMALYKFITPVEPTIEYHTHKYWANGIKYILEIRMTQRLDVE